MSLQLVPPESRSFQATAAFLKRRGLTREIAALPVYAAALERAYEAGVLDGIREVQESVDGFDRELDGMARSSLESLYAFLGSADALRRKPAHSVERQLADRVCGNICSGAMLRPEEEKKLELYDYSHAVAILSQLLYLLDRKSGEPTGPPGAEDAADGAAGSTAAPARQKASQKKSAGQADAEGRKHEPGAHGQEYRILPPPSSKGPLSDAVNAVETAYFPRETPLCEREQRARVLAQRVAFLGECARHKELQARKRSPGAPEAQAAAAAGEGDAASAVSAAGPKDAAMAPESSGDANVASAASAASVADLSEDVASWPLERVQRELAAVQAEVASLLREYEKASSSRWESSVRKLASGISVKTSKVTARAREVRTRAARGGIPELLRSRGRDLAQFDLENTGDDDIGADGRAAEVVCASGELGASGTSGAADATGAASVADAADAAAPAVNSADSPSFPPGPAETPRDAIAAKLGAACFGSAEGGVLLQRLEETAGLLGPRPGSPVLGGAWDSPVCSDALLSRLREGYETARAIQDAEKHCAAILAEAKHACSSHGSGGAQGALDAPDAQEFGEVLECSESDLRNVLSVLGRLGKVYSTALNQAVAAAAAARTLQTLGPVSPLRPREDRLEALRSCADGARDIAALVGERTEGLQDALEDVNVLINQIRDALSAPSKLQHRGADQLAFDDEGIASMQEQARALVPGLSARLAEIRALVSQVAQAHAAYIDAHADLRASYEVIVHSKRLRGDFFIPITKLKKCSCCKVRNWSYMYKPDHSLYCSECQLRKMGLPARSERQGEGEPRSESVRTPRADGAADESVAAGTALSASAPAPADLPESGEEVGQDASQEPLGSEEAQRAPVQGRRLGEDEAARKRARMDQKQAQDWIKISVAI